MTFLALSFLLYFAPALFASSRRHPSATAIWFTNLFFGWTVAGWIICLIWALRAPRAVLFYPGRGAYATSLEMPAYPAGWRPASPAATATPVCGACQRPLLTAANYCMLCGAGV